MQMPHQAGPAAAAAAAAAPRHMFGNGAAGTGVPVYPLDHQSKMQASSCNWAQVPSLGLCILMDYWT